MPSWSCSDSTESMLQSIVMISKLDPRLGLELVSWTRTLGDNKDVGDVGDIGDGDDGDDGDDGEPAHRASSHGEGSGRMQGEGCWSGWSAHKHQRLLKLIILKCDHRQEQRVLVGLTSLPVRLGDPVDVGEELARLEERLLLLVLEADRTFGLLSSTHDGISHTEWRLTLVALPADVSASNSTTGVSMGML